MRYRFNYRDCSELRRRHAERNRTWIAVIVAVIIVVAALVMVLP